MTVLLPKGMKRMLSHRNMIHIWTLLMVMCVEPDPVTILYKCWRYLPILSCIDNFAARPYYLDCWVLLI